MCVCVRERERERVGVCNRIPGVVRGQRGAVTGRFRDVKRCVATGGSNRVPGISLLRPLDHRSTIPPDRATELLTCFRVPQRDRNRERERERKRETEVTSQLSR